MSSGHQRIKWRKNIAENFNPLSRVHERFRQTTDGRTTTYSEHEQEFTFLKKRLTCNYLVFVKFCSVLAASFFKLLFGLVHMSFIKLKFKLEKVAIANAYSN